MMIPSPTPIASRWKPLLAAVGLATLAACGGGQDSDTSSRAGVTIDRQLLASRAAAAPAEPVEFDIRCSGRGRMVYEWNLGDGSPVVTSDSNTLSHRFAEQGDVLPRVTCIDANGARATSTTAAYLRVAVPSHTLTGIEATLTRSADGTLAAFQALCRGNPGDDLRYQWDFGDGTTGSGRDPSHLYAHPAEGTVQHTVTVACIATRPLTDLTARTVLAEQTVRASTTLVAGATTPMPDITGPLTLEPAVPTTAGPTRLRMACTAAGGRPIAYSFEFGDGSQPVKNLTGQATHTYVRDGNRSASQYTVKASCVPADAQADDRLGHTQTVLANVRTPTLSVLAGRADPPQTVRHLAVAADGTLYLSDTEGHAIRRIAPGGVATVLAGTGSAGRLDGPAATATFNRPEGLALGAGGVVYVADTLNHAVRRIAADGRVSTLAGNGTAGLLDRNGTAASFAGPSGLAVDPLGNVYVADTLNHAVRRIAPSGEVVTVAGNGQPGFADGVGAAARFDNPTGVAIDRDGSLVIADRGNHLLRRIGLNGAVTTLAGDRLQPGRVDGTGTAAHFHAPWSVAFDGAGHVLVADSLNHAVRRVAPDGSTVTLAGTDAEGYVNERGPAARFNTPSDLAVRPDGSILVLDWKNSAVRRIDPVAQAAVGTAVQFGTGAQDGAGLEASFNYATGLAIDTAGTVYVADTANNLVRAVSPAGVVRTVAGAALQPGRADGPAAEARFKGPTGIAVDTQGNVFVADSNNHLVRKIAPDGRVSTIAGGATAGSGDDPARFNYPSGLAVDAAGNLFVADLLNHGVRRITPAGQVTRIAGNGVAGRADGLGAAAQFSSPTGLAIDPAGNLYVADQDNHAIRKIAPDGRVTTLAGDGTAGAEDGTGSHARFNRPRGLTLDGDGNLYVADFGNQALRKITPEGVVGTLDVPTATNIRAGEFKPHGIVMSGRRLILGNNAHLATIDFAP